jgi:hypothetical protein
MSEIMTETKLSTIQRALRNANGPLDAEHIAFVIMLANANEGAQPEQEQAEMDFLLIMLINEIRKKQPDERSFENLFELINQNEVAPLEAVLKISQFWKPTIDETTEAILGLKQKLLDLILLDDPDFLPE